jgi:hypothetical protein
MSVHKLVLSIILCCTALVGCVPSSGSISISSVQKEAVAICGYLPLAAVVAQLAGTHAPNLGSVFAMATAICNAVTPKVGFRSGPPSAPHVNGVLIRGKFVR